MLWDRHALTGPGRRAWGSSVVSSSRMLLPQAGSDSRTSDSPRRHLSELAFRLASAYTFLKEPLKSLRTRESGQHRCPRCNGVCLLSHSLHTHPSYPRPPEQDKGGLLNRGGGIRYGLHQCVLIHSLIHARCIF